MKVLFTRTISPQSMLYAQSFGLEVSSLSFISVELYPITEDIVRFFSENCFSAWIFTSVNSAKFASELLRNDSCIKPNRIYCVGAKTASYFEEFSIPVHCPAVAHAASLSDLIIEDDLEGKFCYFKGTMSLEIIGMRLQEAGVDYELVECYQTVLCSPDINPDFFDAVVFYSPSAVQAYVHAGFAVCSPNLYALGETTAASVRSLIGRLAKVPERPDFESLVDCIVGEILER